MDNNMLSGKSVVARIEAEVKNRADKVENDMRWLEDHNFPMERNALGYKFTAYHEVLALLRLIKREQEEQAKYPLREVEIQWL